MDDADAAFAAALQWLPYWTDRQRGLLRTCLIRAENVRRTQAGGAVGSKAVQETPHVTELESDPLNPSESPS